MHTIVNVIKSVRDSCCYTFWSMHLELGVFQADIKLVVLQTPTPVFVGHPVDSSKVLIAKQQNAADEGRLEANRGM